MVGHSNETRAETPSGLATNGAAFMCCTHTSVTIGYFRGVRVLALPATWLRPLPRMWQQRFSQPVAAGNACGEAQPTSRFHSQGVVSGVADRLHAAMCGAYQSVGDAGVWTSPGKPPTP